METLEHVGIWYQDWVDACTYAKECNPDFIALITAFDPYSTVAFIIIVCYSLYSYNEKRIKQRVSNGR